MINGQRALPKPWLTIVLGAICVAAFALELAVGLSPTNPAPLDLMKVGGNFGALTFAGQPWRLLTSVFLHAGILHLAMNMYGLWAGGLLAERIYTRRGMLLIFIGSGLIGAFVSAMHHDFTVSVGASGAIFGIFGAIGAFFVAHRAQVEPAMYQAQLRQLGMFVAINLVFGFSMPGIDMSAHIGGLASGFAIGLALEWGTRLGPRKRGKRQLIVAAVTLAAIVAAVAVIPAPAMPPLPTGVALFGEFDTLRASTLERYNASVEELRNETITPTEFADRIEQEILPPWQDLRSRMEMNSVPDRQTKVRAAAIAVLRTRAEFWIRYIAALRANDPANTELDELARVADAATTALDASIKNRDR